VLGDAGAVVASMGLYTITWRLILPESPYHHPLVLMVAVCAMDSSCHGSLLDLMIQLKSRKVLSVVRVEVIRSSSAGRTDE
jgi:hypothetical protein